jgi:predicted oxidoreductase
MKQNFSDIIAGTMLWGQWGRNLDTETMADLIRHCVQHKITSFDHADIYGSYTTEADFGKAFAASGIRRRDVQFISKCGIKMISPNKNNRIAHYDYTKAHIISSCEQSLRNLSTEYIDLFLMHRPSPLMRGDEMAEAILLLKEQGKILSFGLSNFTPSQAELIRDHIPVTHNQVEFSLTYDQPLTDGSLDYLMLNKIVPMAWAPLGTVFKAETTQTIRIRKVLKVLSKKYEVRDDLLLLNWIIRHPAGIIPVVGTGDKNRISILHKVKSFVMDQEDWFELWQASMGQPIP